MDGRLDDVVADVVGSAYFCRDSSEAIDISKYGDPHVHCPCEKCQGKATWRMTAWRHMRPNDRVREGTFFLGGGRAGASEGRVISENEHQKGRAIPHVSYSREGHTSFPEFFNEIFCDVAFHFSYRLSFSFHLL